MTASIAAESPPQFPAFPLVALIVSQHKDIHFVPLTITLSLNEFNNFFLFCFYAHLLSSESLEFCLFLGQFLPLCIDSLNSGVRILAPDVQ